MGVNQGLVHGVVHPQSPLKLGDEFGVDGAPVVVNQLDLFVGSVVRVAVVDDDVKPVPLTPHEYHQRQRVTHMDWLRDPLTTRAITFSDFHMTSWRCQCKVDWISRVHPKKQSRSLLYYKPQNVLHYV